MSYPVGPSRELAALPKPDLSAFEQALVHSELQRARGVFSKACPKAPTRQPRVATPLEIPLIRNVREVRARLDQSHQSPFPLEVAPGVTFVIDRASFLSNQGAFFDVYQCRVKERKWVLKLPKSTEGIVSRMANQLLRYVQNISHPILCKHMVTHLNFDAHVEATRGFLGLRAAERCHRFEEYVKAKLEQGFLFSPFIPNAFPLEFDEKDSRWQQLRSIFREGIAAGICNDVRRSNVRTLPLKNGEERVVLIDLFELDGEETDPSIYANEGRRTFSDKKEDWICSLP